MTNSTYTASSPSPLWQYWRGLSGWNFYFLKFGLLWAGYLNFHPSAEPGVYGFPADAAAQYQAASLASLGCDPAGFALFWHDARLPGADSIMSQEGSRSPSLAPAPLLDC